MNIGAFFKKKRKDPAPPVSSPPENMDRYDEDEEYDSYDPSPEALSLAATAKKDTSASMMKPAVPGRTTFNKTLVIGAIALLLISAAGAMIYELQTSPKKVSKEETKTASPAGKSDAFADMPSSYSSIKDQKPAAKPAAMIPTAPTGKVPPAPQIPSAPTVSLEERERLAARNSAIGFSVKGGSNTVSPPAQNQAMINPFLQQMAAAAQAAGGGNGGGASTDPQDQKAAFFEKNRSSAWYVKGSVTAAVSDYEVKAGAIIPGVMLTGIKSDLPGQVVGQVRENVYDSQTGQYLLIPQGTKIIGIYDSKIQYGQDRVLLVWTRLIFPNGESLDIENMGATDGAGYSGLHDKTNNHTGRLITGILLGSVATAGATIAAGNSSTTNQTYGQAAVQGAATNVANAVADITRKNLAVQPTIEIRPGWKFNVFVNKDLILKPYTD